VVEEEETKVVIKADKAVETKVVTKVVIKVVSPRCLKCPNLNPSPNNLKKSNLKNNPKKVKRRSADGWTDNAGADLLIRNNKPKLKS